MDEETAKAVVLQWASGASTEERRQFLSAFLDVIPLEEIQKLNNSVAPHAKKRKRYRRPEGSNTSAQKKTKSSTPSKHAELLSTPAAASVSVSVPAPASVSVPVPAKPKPWWQSYRKSDILALDCEMISKAVALAPGQTRERYKQELAEISLCGFDGSIIMDKLLVYHAPGSFLLDSKHRQITGFNRNSFINGKPFEEVKNQVEEQINSEVTMDEAEF